MNQNQGLLASVLNCKCSALIAKLEDKFGPFERISGSALAFNLDSAGTGIVYASASQAVDADSLIHQIFRCIEMVNWDDRKPRRLLVHGFDGQPPTLGGRDLEAPHGFVAQALFNEVASPWCAWVAAPSAKHLSPTPETVQVMVSELRASNVEVLLDAESEAYCVELEERMYKDVAKLIRRHLALT